MGRKASGRGSARVPRTGSAIRVGVPFGSECHSGQFIFLSYRHSIKRGSMVNQVEDVYL
jgi:hypothetical protein